MIRMVPIKSSSIAAVGYDPQKQDLHIRFQKGYMHVYSKVPADKHVALMNAPSAGKYFIDKIKDLHAARKI